MIFKTICQLFSKFDSATEESTGLYPKNHFTVDMPQVDIIKNAIGVEEKFPCSKNFFGREGVKSTFAQGKASIRKDIENLNGLEGWRTNKTIKKVCSFREDPRGNRTLVRRLRTSSSIINSISMIIENTMKIMFSHHVGKLYFLMSQSYFFFYIFFKVNIKNPQQLLPQVK